MTYLLVGENQEYLCAAGEELNTDRGILAVPTDAVPGDVVETHLGAPFTVQELRGPDFFHHFERTGAPMLPRDAGLVLGETGVGVGDDVLDAGTGTGVLAAYLGRGGASVVTYERRPEFAAVARENMQLAGVEDRVEVVVGDVTEALSTLGTVDVITLDTADAPTVVAAAPELLRPGGALAVYAPFVEHAREAAMAAREAGLDRIRTMETIQREMDFDDRGSRPTPSGVGHTGFLTFARRR